MKRILSYVNVLICLFLTALPNLADDAPTATDFLKQSMSRYQVMTSFQAQCLWRNEMFDTQSGPSGAGKSTDSRVILYAAPNQFKITSSHTAGAFVQTAVSNGKQLVEYSNLTPQAMTYTSPPSLADVSSMMMKHPMFCGSLLYQFFGGPGSLPQLVNIAKGAVTYGDDVSIGGTSCKTIRFYATGLYGHTQVAIGANDHLVYRITYDSEPLIALMKTAMMRAQVQKAMKGKAFSVMTGSMTTEDYGQIGVDQPIASTAFDTTLPKGLTVTDMSQSTAPAPPVALGSPAPDFQVSPLGSRRQVALSSLRGRVVLVDFWATWCPPCRKSLPETQRLFHRFGAKGLTVMTISDEDQIVIGKFVKANHYTFPTYRDAAHSADKAYKVEAIPTLVVIDKTGNLVAYMVGLQEPETVLAALKKAGLQTP